MNWKDSCLTALTETKLFITSQHKTRFKELMDCYGDKPFLLKVCVNVCICQPGMMNTFLSCSRC